MMKPNSLSLFAIALAALSITAGCAMTGAEAQPQKGTTKMETGNADQLNKVAAPQKDTITPTPKVIKTKDEWRKLLPSGVFNVTREAGTEPPFHNAYYDMHEKGTFYCACCGLELFKSDTKFDSGTGWPSFYAPVAKNRIADHRDSSFGMERDEVVCARCAAHLGHVFDDGPKPTGLRYCMNSASLVFVPAKK